MPNRVLPLTAASDAPTVASGAEGGTANKVSLEPLLVPNKQAAFLCGMSLASWHRKNAAGLIGPKPIRIGRGCVRFRAREIQEWIASGCPDRVAWQALQVSKGNGKSLK